MSNEETNEVLLNLHFKFLWSDSGFSMEDFLNNYPLKDKHYIVLWGGASSGKSYSISQRLAFEFLHVPNNNILVVRSAYILHSNSTYKDLLDRIKEWGGEDDITAVTSPQLLITNKNNGNKIQFKGTDDINKLKSVSGVNKIWIEEADQIEKSDFDQLCIRMRGKPYKGHTNQMFISFNPTKEDSWLKKEFFDSDIHINDTYINHSTFLDNQFIDDITKDKLIKSEINNPSYYKVYGLGNWGTIEGKIYNNYIVEDFNIDNFDKYSVGLDFGSTDPTAIVLVAKDHDVIYVCKEFKRSSMTNGELSRVIKDEFDKYKCTIIADSAQKGQIDSLKYDYHVRMEGCKKGPDSVIKGIKWLQDKSVVIHPSCKDFIREIDNYEWKKIGETYTNQPVDRNNHLLDAWRYACGLWMEKKVDHSSYIKSNNIIKFDSKW